ncbi:MAG: oxygenase MpaB family protein [Acidimicrobiales bacterium]
MTSEPRRQDRSRSLSATGVPKTGVSAQPLGPGSLMWSLGFDRRALLLAGRALVMQVAHPVIGAGVADFSTFRTDPWGRLDRTLGSLQTQLFGGPDAIVEAERLRRLHAGIKGVGFNGKRYRALDPQAQTWVHLSNLDTLLCWHGRFGRPLDEAQQAQVLAEWRQVGLVLGVDRRQMPGDLASFHAYVADMVENHLEDNPTVREVLAAMSLSSVPPPPWVPWAGSLLSRTAWGLARPLGRVALHDATVGTLPEGLRHKLNLEWSRQQEQRLSRVAEVIRLTAPLIPDRLAHYPRAYRAQQAARAHRGRAIRVQGEQADPAGRTWSGAR